MYPCRAEAHSAIETPTDVNFERLESHLEVQPWPLSRQAKVSFLFLLVMGFSVSYMQFIAVYYLEQAVKLPTDSAKIEKYACY